MPSWLGTPFPAPNLEPSLVEIVTQDPHASEVPEITLAIEHYQTREVEPFADWLEHEMERIDWERSALCRVPQREDPAEMTATDSAQHVVDHVVGWMRSFL